MTMVRFATTCDRCTARSEEYSAWASCRACLEDICPSCSLPGSEQDESVDMGEAGDGERVTVLCRECAADLVTP